MNEQHPTTIEAEPHLPTMKSEPNRQPVGPDSERLAADEFASSESHPASFGIDLGTYTTRAAAYRDGLVQFIAPLRMRSTIYISPERDLLVGTAASDDRPGGIFIDTIKPKLGTAWSMQVGRTTWWNASDCLNKILAGAKAHAHEQLATAVNQAVLSVPHSYNARQRALFKQCTPGVDFDSYALINETTAAAFYWCHKNQRHNCTIIVVSLGSEYLSASLVEVTNKVLQVKYSAGASGVGGNAIDECISQWTVLQNSQHHTHERLPALGLTMPLSSVSQVLTREQHSALCEKAKLDILTGATSDAGLSSAFIPLSDHPVVLNGNQFEKIVEATMRQITQTIEDVASVANRDGLKPERVLFVGNGSRAPYMWSTIAKAACKGMQPDAKDADSDLYVAGGAALYAAILAKQLPEWTIHDTLTIPIGVELPGGIFKMLASKDTPLPVVVRQSLQMPESGRLNLKFIQGDDVIDEVVVKDAAIGLHRPRPIELAMHLAADGTASYFARDRELGVNLSVHRDLEEPVLVQLA